MSRTEKETLDAADHAACLSVFIEREGFEDSDLRLLSPHHLKKFCEAMTKQEANRLEQIASQYYWTNIPNSSGLPLLDSFWTTRSDPHHKIVGLQQNLW